MGRRSARALGHLGAVAANAGARGREPAVGQVCRREACPIREPALPDQCQTIQAAPRFSLESRPEEASLLKRLLAVMPAGDSLVERLAWGSRFVAVRASGGVGLASTLGARPDDADQDAMAGLVGQTLADVASLLPSPSPILASLGLAALNAACPAPAGARAESSGS